MSILIGQYEFEGPISAHEEVPTGPCLYAILHQHDRDFLLVDIDQTLDLARTLSGSKDQLAEKMIVVLPCANASRRKEILHELLREFEFEDDEPVASAPARRTETKAGSAVAI
jgi:hypothetical protein